MGKQGEEEERGVLLWVRRDGLPGEYKIHTKLYKRDRERERERESHREVSGSTPAGREESLADACAPFLVCLFWELDSCGVGRET